MHAAICRAILLNTFYYLFFIVPNLHTKYYRIFVFAKK